MDSGWRSSGIARGAPHGRAEELLVPVWGWRAVSEAGFSSVSLGVGLPLTEIREAWWRYYGLGGCLLLELVNEIPELELRSDAG